MTTTNDLVGRQFGRLFVLARHGSNGRGGATWLCLCACGREKVILGSNLIQGKSLSCKCIANEMAGLRAKTMVKHGAARDSGHSPEYRSWKSMIGRCRYECVNSSKYYLGRGITVCERWLDFRAFLEDMGLKPSIRHTIDRLDNDGNYEPGNCRWATPLEQAANKRSKRLERPGDYPEVVEA